MVHTTLCTTLWALADVQHSPLGVCPHGPRRATQASTTVAPCLSPLSRGSRQGSRACAPSAPSA
eukprot:4207640-Alexandrium_andersonii.AAC.1